MMISLRVAAIAASIAVAAPASAQITGFGPTAGTAGVFVPPVTQDFYHGDTIAGFGFHGERSGVTPAMRRERLATLIALRDEMVALRVADGGTLSDANRAYLTDKARRLLRR